MMFRPFRKMKPDDRVRALVRCLTRCMDRELRRAGSRLHRLLDAPSEARDLIDVLLRLRRIRTGVAELQGIAGLELLTHLREFSTDLLDVLRLLGRERHEARRSVARSLDLLIAAETELADVINGEVQDDGIRRIVVSSALLFQAHFSLFPAERMLLGSGRAAGSDRILNGLYQVTGAHHPHHVQAEPALLSKALIAMESSETFLLAWLHSHPGNGAEATWPSSIDKEQHGDWIRNYSPDLLSVIMVADRYVRFWGTALEQGHTNLEVVGPGVEKTEEDNVYRLIQ